MEGVAGGLEAVEVPLRADDVGDAEAVELVPERSARAGNCEHDAAILQLAGEFGEGLAAGLVDVVDRVGVEDDPARPIRHVDEAEDLLGEALGVRVEKPDFEPVDDEAGLGDGAGGGRHQLEGAGRVPADHGVVRRVFFAAVTINSLATG